MGYLAGGPGTSAWSLWDGWQVSCPVALQGVGHCGAQEGPAAACGVAQCCWGHTGPALIRALGASMMFGQTGTADLVLDNED